MWTTNLGSLKAVTPVVGDCFRGFFFSIPHMDLITCMKPAIALLVDRYGRFEQRVRHHTERWCRPFCSACRQVCCQAGFCAETRESRFLMRVVRRFSGHAVFSPSNGWLSSTGCTLVAGRPPVCYEFLCRPITDAVSSDPKRRYAMRVSSMLVSHVGMRAIGGRHLVEATRAADLDRVNPERFIARLDEAEKAFCIVADILDGQPSGSGIQALSRIVTPPRNDDQEIRRVM
jgi:hypothetical protein